MIQTEENFNLIANDELLEHVKLATKLFYSKVLDYEKAIIYAEKWLLLQPRNGEALFLMGES